MKIKSIKIKTHIDENPDLSWLGEYSSQRKKWAIDRKARHDLERNQHRYFHPARAPTSGMNHEERRVAWNQCEMDYERMEKYNKCDWQMNFLQAEAEVDISLTIQRITSGGIGGIESDSSQDYLDMIEAEQKDELAHILKEMGFGETDITEAMEAAECT